MKALKPLILLVAGIVFLPFCLTAGAEDKLQIGAFNRSAVDIIATEKGFFKEENIALTMNLVGGSVELMRNFINGRYDLIQTNADNVIAWAEGQGEDPQTNDFIIFLGGYSGLKQRLVVLPSIKSFDDIKGKVLEVDDPRTGYAAVLAFILKTKGLTFNKDYTVKPFGNNSGRLQAMGKGEAVGALINLPEEDLKKTGFPVLARSEDYLPVYARGVGAARRDWAARNEALLVRYIRALVRATNWIFDPKNEAEALDILLPPNRNSAPRAKAMYQDVVDPKLGFTPGSRIDIEGIRMVIQLREVIGLMKPPLPSPQKYVDERFYKKAISSLTP